MNVYGDCGETGWLGAPYWLLSLEAGDGGWSRSSAYDVSTLTAPAYRWACASPAWLHWEDGWRWGVAYATSGDCETLLDGCSVLPCCE